MENTNIEENKVESSGNKNNQKGYGILSLMAMIIGIVIGSGIFAKNASLIGSAGSVGAVVFSWILGALIVVTLVIAFLEVISITEIAGEQATLANWGRRLIGIKFGKFLGVYFALAYFPIVMAGLFQVGADSVVQSISYLGGSTEMYNNLLTTPAAYWGVIVAVAALLFIAVATVNAITSLPGKYFQNIGTMIKTIPLFFIIIVFIVMLMIGDVSFASRDDILSAGIDDGGTGRGFSTLLLAVMTTMPAILFSFDGFLIAGSLSKEGKKPSTFRIAFISSIIFIIVIYLLYSLAILGLGTVESDHGSYGSVSNAIYAVFENETLAGVINALVTIIITISILTTASGCNIATYRMGADLSVNNFVEDKDGFLLERNKFGMNMKGAFVIMAITGFWFILGSSFDAILLIVTNPTTSVLGGTTNQVSLFGLDMVIVWAYFIYATIIFGAILNRFNHKNLVNKNAAFWPSAVASIILVTIVTVIFAGQILLPGGNADAVYWAKMIYTLIFFIYIGAIYYVIGLKTTSITGVVEVPKELQEAADSGDEAAKADVERINNKNNLVAEYFGISVQELHVQREAVNIQLAEAKKQREALQVKSTTDSE